MTKPLVLKLRFSEEIFKINNLSMGQKGTVLVIALVIMGVMLLLGSYFLNLTLGELRIARSQVVGTQAYYIAEAGVNHAIWKLKYDDTEGDGDVPWATCFVTSTESCDCQSWSASFTTGTEELLSNSTVSVSIQNLECARGKIVATSTVVFQGQKTAQRVVETVVFKSLASPTQGAAILSGGSSENVDIKFSRIRVYGSLFSNHNLDIKWQSTVEVVAATSGEGKILAVGNYNKSSDSTVSSTAVCAKNTCQTTSTCGCIAEEFEKCEIDSCPPVKLSMPVVDFDSEATTSFKSRAQAVEDAGDCQVFCKKENQATTTCSTKCVFTASEFEDLLWEVREGGTLTLGSAATPTITYITGQVEARGGRHLIVNGALVADGTIDIGEGYSWTRQGEKDQGFSQVTVNRPTPTTTSAILTKGKINFGLYSSFTTTTIVGVVYANDEIRLTSLPETFKITGGMIARKLALTSVWEWLEFILDDEIINYGLGYKIDGDLIDPEYSPIITVEHWEETY